MTWFFVCLVFFGLFHRELLFGVLSLIHRPRLMNLSVSGTKSGRFQLLATKNLSEGLISFPSFFGLVVLVDQDLWSKWSRAEQEALVLWCFASATHNSTFRRILDGGDVHSSDRASLFMGSSSATLWAALQKIEESQKLKSQNSLNPWSGLSPIGPSWFGPWPPIQERMSVLSRESSKLL